MNPTRPDDPDFVAINDCLAGRISPQVAVARMLLTGVDVNAIVSALDAADEDSPIARIRSLILDHRDTLDALAAEVSKTAQNHSAEGTTPAEGVARIAAFFDRAVLHSPEASVALYSLGNPTILAAATHEIVVWLSAQHLLPDNADVVDVGCGIGRVTAALAPRCRSVLALDVSPGMVAEAARRLAALPNVVVRQTAGEDLDWLAPAAFDLVMAIDSFPYVIQANAALRHFEGAARALRPGGALCILNLSYRGDPNADRQDVTDWAKAAGLRVVTNGVRPFTLWDGVAFVLAR